MSVLYLVRHGQASFGTDDYDRLSDLGKDQSRITGKHLAAQRVAPVRIVHGEMLRQRQTAEGIQTGLGSGLDPHIDSGWNEYQAWELTGALTDPDPRAQKDSKIFQAELERGAARWASGDYDGDYTESFKEFTTRVNTALDDACATMSSGESTIIVSSAGAIAWTAARLLGGGFDQWMAFNRVTVNTGITRIVTGRSGTSLISFNEHGHQIPEKVTYR
ncbi:histidine phosphatase family protein [Brevibacterium aurantiacum]|uniref:Histidine phosphatase family protein n=1 Tax=Brevibacterium aurantiacum TaxID=273384 RepID=A0A556C8W1_BREAU|nr:histidine phosphatase family protein [Brevibacterium aurantiacum]TSI13889.1 histidine phosphatase family protein [Brevibacterium aurantiacum]